MSNTKDTVLLEIFPTEIWLPILEYLKDAKDHHKLLNASSQFRALLLAPASQLLFPLVSQRILRQVPGELGAKTEIVLGRHVGPYRHLCKAWKQEVDNVLQTQHFIPNFISARDESSQIFESCLGFNFERFSVPNFIDIYNFHQHFDSTHSSTAANPFLCRGVALHIHKDPQIGLKDENWEDLDDFYWVCMPTLEKYGHHLWSCVITADETYLYSEGNIFQFHKSGLKLLLKMMPNLQTLEIKSLFLDLSPIHLIEKLEAEMQNNLFPTLPRLRFFNFSGVHFITTRGILQANPHVEQIKAATGCSNNVVKAVWKKGN